MRLPDHMPEGSILIRNENDEWECRMPDYFDKRTTRQERLFLIWVFILSGVMFLIAGFIWVSYAHAHDKHYPPMYYAQSTLKKWFDSLKSVKGPCCSDADGTALKDVEWENNAGRYRVFVEGEWRDVPDDAVLKQPNLYGSTMVWTIVHRGLGHAVNVEIRCFIPGVMM